MITIRQKSSLLFKLAITSKQNWSNSEQYDNGISNIKSSKGKTQYTWFQYSRDESDLLMFLASFGCSPLAPELVCLLREPLAIITWHDILPSFTSCKITAMENSYKNIKKKVLYLSKRAKSTKFRWPNLWWVTYWLSHCQTITTNIFFRVHKDEIGHILFFILHKISNKRVLKNITTSSLIKFQ